jgi:hypothetical protein
MAINPAGTLPPELFAEQQQLNRQQQMAQALMQQGAQQPQGQMISGRYVAPSFFQNILPLVQMYAGNRMAEQGDKKALDLAARLRTRQGEDVKSYMEAMTPVAAKEGGIIGPDGKLTMQTTPDMFDANMQLNPQFKQVQAVAGRGPDFARAFQVAYNSYDPALRAQALDMLKTQKLGEGESLNRMDFTTGQLTPIGRGGEKVSPDIRTAAQMLGIVGDPSTFTPQQTQAVANQVTANKRAGATNVSVNTANKFAGGFADKASGGAYDMYTAALNAPQAIENSKRTIDLVNSGALTGTGADLALQAAKIFNVAGADNKDTISKTEMLVANRGKSLLGSIKASGLAGSQGLTEGERKFLTQAEGGTITLDGETLKAMAGLEIKMAVNNQKKWNQQASRMDPDILRVTGAGPVEVYTGVGSIDLSNPLLKK